MVFFKKYRWALLACLLAAAVGGFLAMADGSKAGRDAHPGHVKDWGTCPDETKIESLAKGFSTPKDGVITKHLEQSGCSVAVKDPTGTILYTELIRSHHYVVVTGNGFTVTRLVDGRNPEDCKVGLPYDRCFFSHDAVD
ncbi:hypothetical protein GCM10010402_00950 [Actinomadura luteofluorescens]|uniref:hypothetical protein n=1 Tax=Actinomadura luteofluorescens TaxID=46163 RepID=UPI00216480D6|nr:hypothetical protein [Actinomadura glauciflava]MCR3745594.1 hypothetical protein [Actinomadura glauciflava]